MGVFQAEDSDTVCIGNAVGGGALPEFDPFDMMETVIRVMALHDGRDTPGGARFLTGRRFLKMAMLPNGRPLDMDMLETAMEDADLTHRYFLNLVTGEVVFFSDYLGLSAEDEQLLEEIDESGDYVVVERIPTHEAYQWMVDFVDELVVPADGRAAEQLFSALDGRGAFRRFKNTLHRMDERWLQAWYQCRDRRLKAAVDEWVRSVL